MSEIRIGTSGWSYDHWTRFCTGRRCLRGKQLGRYVQEFDTVELNASFCRWAPGADIRRAGDAGAAGVPDECESPPRPGPRPTPVSARALDAPVRAVFGAELRDRRGVLLVQLPPDQERDDDRLDYFLHGLPDWMQVAIELRHPVESVTDPVFDLLSRHHAPTW